MLAALLCIGIIWLGFAALCGWAQQRNVRDDVMSGLATLAAYLHARVVQNVRYEGLEHVPTTGPLIVVANHTSGVDPLLLQGACRFHIRWMMMRAMMLPILDGLWTFLEIIPVGPKDSASARTALRHLKDGGVLGIFPEGNIERPAGKLMPFLPGTGVIIQRSSAPVLLAAIDGTPAKYSAFLSILIPGRSRVRFIGVVDYSSSGLDAAGIVADMQRRIAELLG